MYVGKSGEVVNGTILKYIVAVDLEDIPHHLVCLDESSLLVIQRKSHYRHIEYVLVYFRSLTVGFVLLGFVGDVGDSGYLAYHITFFVKFRNGIGIEYSPYGFVLCADVVSV